MAGPCKTSGCDRAPQVIGVLKGVCCSLCGVTDPNRHAVLCDIIEEAARVEVGEDDKTVVLGYN